MNPITIIIFLLMSLFMLQNPEQQPMSSDLAPTFEFTTFDGDSYSLADFSGNVVVINFWASWCAPCYQEAPELQAAWEHYSSSDDVVFIGITYADMDSASIDFIEEQGITYLTAPDTGTLIADMYRIEGVPETIIIDKDGMVADYLYGVTSTSQLRLLIDPLVGGN